VGVRATLLADGWVPVGEWQEQAHVGVEARVCVPIQYWPGRKPAALPHPADSMAIAGKKASDLFFTVRHRTSRSARRRLLASRSPSGPESAPADSATPDAPENEPSEIPSATVWRGAPPSRSCRASSSSLTLCRSRCRDSMSSSERSARRRRRSAAARRPASVTMAGCDGACAGRRDGGLSAGQP
jgi:hypothetical protein